MRKYRLALAGGCDLRLSIHTTANEVSLEGAATAIEAAARLIQVIDQAPDTAGRDVRLIPIETAQLTGVQRAAAAIEKATRYEQGPAMAPPQRGEGMPAPAGGRLGHGTATPPPGMRNTPLPGRPAERPADNGVAALVNPVQVEMIDGLNVLVLRGNARDVEQVMEIVKQIEKLSGEIEPLIEILPMRHLDCTAIASSVRSLYDEVYTQRQGSVSITPIITPNAILIVGPPENVKRVIELAGRLDQPMTPGTQYQVFHLKHVSAASAQTTVQNALVDRGGLSPIVRVSVDTRSNALIVQASPRDMAEVAELIRRIDVTTSAAVNEVRIIQLQHSLAQDIASILQSAIGAATGSSTGSGGTQGGQGQNPQGPGGQMTPGASPFGQNMPGQGFRQGQQGNQAANNAANASGANRSQNDQRAAMLRFLTIDAKGRKLIDSGILTDVRVTADVRANALVISSPAENFELIEALVRQLDGLPASEAQIKVFTIVNGDATSLAEMLRSLYGVSSTQGSQQGSLSVLQTIGADGETSLVPLRFGVDTRTNSIITSGTLSDLNVVEAILTRLDDGEVRHRKSVVLRLKNSPATDVANTLNQFLRSEQQVQKSAPGIVSAFEQIEREVVVTPEPVSNSLVLSATPRFFEEIKGIIEQLDARPPMVMVQVLIASVTLGSTNEFGVELGLQDSVLFDRSTLSNLVTTSTTLSNGTTTSTVISGDATPGYNFNNGNSLGNSYASSNTNTVGGQGISNFGTGRTNSNLGYSGLVLSAQSSSISVLLRALAQKSRVDILQRPQIMTLDNQPAFIQVGQRVPRITGVSNNATTGNTNSITLDNVGLILGITPRISPDGLVVMEIDVERSSLESDTTGIPIYTSPTGQVIRSPIIDATTAQTTVSAMSDQTVVIGGLITKEKDVMHRSVPFLGEIPILGNLFRYDSNIVERTELLVIMTPHIVRNAIDAEVIKRVEAGRMSWCINDVTALYGEAGLRQRRDPWPDKDICVIYPDGEPPCQAPKGPELVVAQPPAQPPAQGPGEAPAQQPWSQPEVIRAPQPLRNAPPGTPGLPVPPGPIQPMSPTAPDLPPSFRVQEPVPPQSYGSGQVQ